MPLATEVPPVSAPCPIVDVVAISVGYRGSSQRGSRITRIPPGGARGASLRVNKLTLIGETSMQTQRSEAMRRKTVIGIVVVVAVAGLLYAFHTMDLMGMLLSMHAPPEGSH